MSSKKNIARLARTTRLRNGPPAQIGDQFVSITDEVLCLKNVATRDSAAMGRLHALGTLTMTPFIAYLVVDMLAFGDLSGAVMFSVAGCVPALLAALMFRHISIIRSQSDFYFNRVTKRVYWHDGERLVIGDWNGVQAGPRSIAEATGGGVVVCFYLEMILPLVNPPFLSTSPEWRLRLEGNDVSDPRPEFTTQVWEYVRQFMEKGPRNLPQPLEERWWWYQPPRKVYLTPKEALLRYLPWHTGVPGEREGKAWWTLPIWAVMFPYNMLLMLCWWATCKVFKVRPADPPPEAFEGGRGAGR